MHIPHKYYEEMCEKSDTFFLDVLLKHEAKHEDMICIMKEQQNYLGKGYSGKVLSGGDQLTCEKQCCAQRHASLVPSPSFLALECAGSKKVGHCLRMRYKNLMNLIIKSSRDANLRHTHKHSTVPSL